MNDPRHDDELHSQPLYVPQDVVARAVGRRRFLQAFGGITVLCLTKRAVSQEAGESGEAGRPGSGGGGFDEDLLSSWLNLAEDGSITAYTGKVEVGQGIRTSLAMVVAEELRVPYAAVAMVMGDTDRVPYDRGTFGSRTTPQMVPVLRKAGAAGRDLLLELAAEQWQVERSGLELTGGRVTHAASGRSIGYGELVRGRHLVRGIADAEGTPHERWSTAGQPQTPVNAVELVTGAHRYPSDIVRVGMVHAKVLRPPSFGAKLATMDASAAEAMPAVQVVHDGDFVGVVAPNEQIAEAAVAGIRAEWQTRPQPSEAELIELLRPRKAASLADPAATNVGDGLALAEVKLEATYTVAYLAHVPLEPRAAVAEWSADGRLTVWTGTQRPFGVREELAREFGLPPERIRVLQPDTGSGYGGKHTGDAAIEAARLAKAAGRPVKLCWTRDEEFTWAYLRPAGVMDILSGVKRDGTLTAWEHHTYNAGGAGLGMPYEVAHQKVEAHRSDSPLRQGSYRGLAAPANFFARESHLDELAQAIGMDPVEFRLKNLRNERIRNVLTAAAETFGWGQPLPDHHGAGIACGTEKGSVIATAVEVAVVPATGEVKLVRTATAFECGKIINPDAVRNQVEGMISMALGGALFERIRFGDGRILNPHLSEYRVPRFSDQPRNEVVLLDRPDLTSVGAGETPMAALAPAVAGGIFQVTGERRRGLPLAEAAAG